MAVCQSGELIKINDWSRMRLWWTVQHSVQSAVILHRRHLHSSLLPTTATEHRENTHFDYLPLITERLGQVQEHMRSHLTDREVVSRRARSLVTDHLIMFTCCRFSSCRPTGAFTCRRHCPSFFLSPFLSLLAVLFRVAHLSHRPLHVCWSFCNHSPI